MHSIPRESEALQLLKSYLRVLGEDHVLATPELRRAVVNHVYDLAALALGATRDAEENARHRGVRAARLRAMKADVIGHLGDPDLHVAAVAVRHGVTPRYVQKLFEADGTTFSQFLLDQRLAHVRRMLSGAQSADHNISAIAFAAGFGDLSHFNRAFRRRYGEAPSDVRAAARRDRDA